MHRILISDSLESSGIEILRSSGAEVTLLAEADRPRLAEILPDYDALVVRSMTKVTRELIAAGTRLKVIGRAGIGVDNIDVPAATERGILVVNAPTANLMSACEHTFALLFSLARAVPAADATMKAGQWNRKPFVGVELDGKTMGIVGFGRIGQRVAERAKGFGMKVIAYDPFLDAATARRLEVEPAELDDLVARCDVLTFHTPLTGSNRGLLSAERIATMKKGALVVNCARGGLIDEPALLAALDSGHLGGAALDVYAEEPPTYWDLARHPKVVATPHIGAQTREAQERIAIETAQMVLAALAGSKDIAAVNLPATAAELRSATD
jgi:D-3-phosphoglycerate dehydrogenase